MKTRKIDIERYIPEYLKSTISGDKTDFYKLFENFEKLLNYSYNTEYYENTGEYSRSIYNFDGILNEQTSQIEINDISVNSETYQAFTDEHLTGLSSSYIMQSFEPNNTIINDTYYNNIVNNIFKFLTTEDPAYPGLPLVFVGAFGKPQKPILKVNLVGNNYILDSESIPSINYYTNQLYNDNYIGNATPHYNEICFNVSNFIREGISPFVSEFGLTGLTMFNYFGAMLDKKPLIRNRIIDLANKMIKEYYGATTRSISEYESRKIDYIESDENGIQWNALFLRPDPIYFNTLFGAAKNILTEILLAYLFLHIENSNVRYYLISNVEKIVSASNAVKTYYEVVKSIQFNQEIASSLTGVSITDRSDFFEQKVFNIDTNRLLIGSDTPEVMQRSWLWVPSIYYPIHASGSLGGYASNPKKSVLKNREFFDIDLNFIPDGIASLWGQIGMWAIHRIYSDNSGATGIHLSADFLNDNDIKKVKIPRVESLYQQENYGYFGFELDYFTGSSSEMIEKFAEVDNTPLSDKIEFEMNKTFGTDDNAFLPDPYSTITVGQMKIYVRRFYRMVIIPVQELYTKYFNYIDESFALLSYSFKYLGLSINYDKLPSSIVNNTTLLSVLEKMDEIQYIGDAEKTSMINLRSIVSSMGFNIDIDVNDIALLRFNDSYNNLNSFKQLEVRLIARRFVKSIPSIIKSKTTKSLLNSIFAVFGVNTNVIDYYTKDYSETDNTRWIQTVIDDSITSREQYYPTAHFGISINVQDINEGKTDYLGDTNRFTNPGDYMNPPSAALLFPNNTSYEKYVYNGFETLTRIIDSIRPVNSVFRGIFLNIFLDNINKINLVTDVVANMKYHIPWTPETAIEYTTVSTFGGVPYLLAKPAGVAHEHINQGSLEIPAELLDISFAENEEKEYTYEVLDNNILKQVDEYSISNITSESSQGKTQIESYDDLESSSKYFLVDQSDCEVVDKLVEYNTVSTQTNLTDRFTKAKIYINRVYNCGASGGTVIVEPDTYVQIVDNLQRSTDNKKIIVSGLGIPGLNEVQITGKGTGGSHYTTTSGSNESIAFDIGTNDPAEPTYSIYNKWFIAASWYDSDTRPQMLFNPRFDRKELPTKVILELKIYMMVSKGYSLQPGVNNLLDYYIVPLKVDWDPQVVSGLYRKSGIAWQSPLDAGQHKLFSASEAYYDAIDGFEETKIYPIAETEFLTYNNNMLNNTAQYTYPLLYGSGDFFFPNGYKNQHNQYTFTVSIDVTDAVRRTLDNYGNARFAIHLAPDGGVSPDAYNNIYFATSKIPSWGDSLKPKMYVEYATATITPPDPM